MTAVVTAASYAANTAAAAASATVVTAVGDAADTAAAAVLYVYDPSLMDRCEMSEAG